MTARYNHHIYKVYIADGFTIDCDELIYRCLQLPKLDYQEFSKVWKDMDFSMIFHCRNTGAEIAELSEELVYISKRYMIKNTSSFEESVAGVFLVYGVLSLQPYPNFAWLRLTPDDIPAVKRIETVARREKRLDVLYILGEILIKFTQYHAVERERGMESVLRKYLEGYTSIDKLGVRPKGVFYKQNEELDIIRDLGSITRQYSKAKNSLSNSPDPSLQYINENLAFELNMTLKRIINGAIDDDEDENDEEDDLSEHHYDTVQAIKYKALANTVNPMKHLTAFVDRKVKTSPKQRKKRQSKTDLKSPVGKVKTCSPTKRLSGSPMKRKKSNSNTKKKMFCAEKPDDGEVTADINVKEFDKAEPRVIAEGTADGITRTDRDLNIPIESMPVIIKKDIGKSLEIEFIDEADNSKFGEEENGKCDEADKGDKYDDETASGKEPTDEEEMAVISQKSKKKFTKEFRKKVKVTPVKQVKPLVKKTEKRELKRLHLKSKFRRLGMLPVANFKDSKNDEDLKDHNAGSSTTNTQTK